MHIRIKGFRQYPIPTSLPIPSPKSVQVKESPIPPAHIPPSQNKKVDNQSKALLNIRITRGQNIEKNEIPREKIGVVLTALDEYANPTWRLYKCVSDAIHMRKFLKSVYEIPPQNFKIAYNKTATKQGIFKAWKWLTDNYQYGIWYHSGHGFWTFNRDEPDNRAEGIVCYDHAWSRANMVLDDDVKERLSVLKRCWVIVDACHASGISKDVNKIGRVKSICAPPAGVKIGPRKRTATKDIIELAACLSTEFAYELNTGGVFTTTLIEILTEFPEITFKKLEEKLRDKIKQQTPVITGEGNMAFFQ